MINLSLGEKIKYFINMLSSSASALYVMGILLVITLIILLVCRKNNKTLKNILIGIYFVIIISIIVIYHKQLISLIDYFVESIVANLLFPNIVIYMGVLLIINAIVIISLLSNKVKYYVKSINIVYFGITQLFIYLIIENIISNNINVYEKLSVYANQNLLILIELSMQLFIVWIIVLMIIKFVDYLMEKSNEKSIIAKNDINVNNEVVFENNYNNDYNKIKDYNTINELIEYVPIKKKKRLEI